MFNAIFMCIIDLAKYFISDIGKNCPASQIIDTENECKNSAADVLGLSFEWSLTDKGFPAGCYWKDTKAFFNTIIDPSQTNQKIFGNRGGVCVRTGKYRNIISEYLSLR